jgi:hypothetical protein
VRICWAFTLWRLFFAILLGSNIALWAGINDRAPYRWEAEVELSLGAQPIVAIFSRNWPANAHLGIQLAVALTTH